MKTGTATNSNIEWVSAGSVVYQIDKSGEEPRTLATFDLNKGDTLPEDAPERFQQMWANAAPSVAQGHIVK